MRRKLGLGLLAVVLVAAAAQTPEATLGAALHEERVTGNLQAAIDGYRKVLAMKGVSRSVAAQAQYHIGVCYEKLGNQEARKAFESVVRDYGDQKDIVAQARTRLAALTAAGGLSYPPTAALRRIWAGPEAELPGFPSPDGRYFTFTDGDGNMVVRDLTTGESRRLTQDRGPGLRWPYSWWGVISPGNTQVAYSYGNELRTVGFDGSNIRTLVAANQEVAYIYPRAWSADQRHILAVRDRLDGSRQMIFVSAVDGATRVLKSLPARTKAGSVGGGETPSLSPDGRYVVYDSCSRQDCDEHDIFLLSVDGSIERMLIQHPSDDRHPAWTPDGKRILFASNRDGNWGFWTIAVADGKPDGTAISLKPDIGELRPSPGFDGQGRYYYIVDAGREDIYIAEMNPNTGVFTEPPVPVPSRFVGRNSVPRWSPDGEYLAYLSVRSGHTSTPPGGRIIVIRSVRTGEEREIAASFRMQLGAVRWFPDGRSLLVGGSEGVDTNPDVTETLYRIDVQTGAARAIRRIRPGALDPTLSPDGRVVYYWQEGQDPGPRLIAHQLESGEEKELYTAVGSWRAALAVSPDGRQLGIAQTDGKSDLSGAAVLKVMPAAGGEARVLLRTDPSANVSYPSRLEWTRDGRYLVFVRLTEAYQNMHTDPGELWRAPVEGGQPQRIGPRMERIRFPSVHPNGRLIAFDSGTTRSRLREVWVMENLLPAGVAAKK